MIGDWIPKKIPVNVSVSKTDLYLSNCYKTLKYCKTPIDFRAIGETQISQLLHNTSQNLDNLLVHFASMNVLIVPKILAKIVDWGTMLRTWLEVDMRMQFLCASDSIKWAIKADNIHICSFVWKYLKSLQEETSQQIFKLDAGKAGGWQL